MGVMKSKYDEKPSLLFVVLSHCIPLCTFFAQASSNFKRFERHLKGYICKESMNASEENGVSLKASTGK